MKDLSWIGVETREKALLSIAIIAIVWFVRLVVLRVVDGRTEDVGHRYRWRKTTRYVGALIAILSVGRVWFPAFESLSTFLGFMTAGLAVALQDPIVNLAGWFFALWRRPLEVGDRIEIAGHKGDVIDIRIFQFTLLEVGNWVGAEQSTGRIIHIPNGALFREPLANYNKGFAFIWVEVPVLVTFESDWQRAKAILAEIADANGAHLAEDAAAKVQQAARRYMIHFSRLTPIVYTSVRDCGVLLTLRFVCEPRTRRSVEGQVWESILLAFAAEAHIDFAYPTQRFYNNATEGKAPVQPAPDPTGTEGSRPEVRAADSSV